jgi:protein-S-isoprenylcysteine O-methyltransferase Ste14
VTYDVPLQPVGLPGIAVLAIGFVVFIVALLAARHRSPASRSFASRDSRSWTWIAVQGLGVAAVGYGPIHIALPPLGSTALLQALAVLLLMGSAVALFHWSSLAMGRHWSLVAGTRHDHQLVTSGPFAYVRNPIYLALFLFMLALAVAYGHYAGLIVGVPLYWFGTAMRVRMEEQILRARFGAEFDTYAAHVKRFIPGFL